MDKKVKRFISSMLVGTLVVSIFLECGSSVENENIDAKGKVHFEGIQVGLCESSSEIADVINEDEEKLNTNVIIELDNYWDVDRESYNTNLSIEVA